MTKYLVYGWTETDQTEIYNGYNELQALQEFAFATYDYDSASMDYWYES